MDVYEEADLYCGAFAWPLDAEVDWLLETVRGVRNVLEPFCGNARYAPHFARHGVEYHGVDLSRSMLYRAPKGPGIHLHQGDVRSFRLPGLSFDLLWCPINSIRHLVPEKDIIDHLACARAQLQPRGTYVVELELVRHEGQWVWKPEHGGEWTQPQADGTEIQAQWRREWCDLAGRTCMERATFRHVVDGAVREETTHLFAMRMWTFDDLLRLTKAAGFRVADAFGRDGESSRPRVPVAREAENDGANRYYFLVPA